MTDQYSTLFRDKMPLSSADSEIFEGIPVST